MVTRLQMNFGFRDETLSTLQPDENEIPSKAFKTIFIMITPIYIPVLDYCEINGRGIGGQVEFASSIHYLQCRLSRT